VAQRPVRVARRVEPLARPRGREGARRAPVPRQQRRAHRPPGRVQVRAQLGDALRRVAEAVHDERRRPRAVRAAGGATGPAERDGAGAAHHAVGA
jgi:hypothetical protein